MICFGTCGGVLVTVLALVDQFARNDAQCQATLRLQQALAAA